MLCSCKQEALPDNPEKENSLKVYVRNNYNSDFVNKAIVLFQEKYPNVKLDKVIINDHGDYTSKVSSELMAGEGPDVVLINSMTDAVSLYKAVDTGVFSDINLLIKNDKEFDLSQYNTRILDSGIFDNKRYIIPIDYDVPVFLTTDEILRLNNIQIDTNDWDIDSFKQILSTYYKNNKQGKYFFSQFVSLNTLIQNDYKHFIDYDTKELNLNSLEFKSFLDLYKILFDGYRNEPRVGEMMNSGDIIADNPIVTNPYELYKRQSDIKFYTGGTIRMYPFPTYTGKKEYTAYPNSMAAIPAKCKNKKAAFDFIKIILSEEIQNSESLDGTPVNKKAFGEIITKLSSESAYRKFGDKYLYNLGNELVSDYKDINENISECIIPNREVNRFISVGSEKYALDGFRVPQQKMIDELEQKLSLFMNE
jgi:multiple sugar transport system substrate-binding protein